MTQPSRIRRTISALSAATAIAACGSAVPQAAAAPAITPIVINADDGSDVTMTHLATYASGVTKKSAAEIASYHPASKHVLITNAESATVDVVSMENPEQPAKLYSLSVGDGFDINSVDVRADGLAVVVANPEGDRKATEKGKAFFFDAANDTDKGFLGSVELGYLPDMVKISADGNYAVVANEGEPTDDYSVDPEGTVSVITLAPTVAAAEQSAVREVSFAKFNGNVPSGVRVSHPKATAAKDFEPEYVTISGTTAYVALQENNAIAVIDLNTAEVTNLFGLGYVDYQEVKTDFSDKDGAFTLKNWPVKGVLMPDGITSFVNNGVTYIVTANEGDGRDYGKKPNKYTDEARVKKLDLCDDFHGMSADEIKALQEDDQLGRLKVLTDMGYDSARDCYTDLYAFGGRGFSIFNAETGQRVFNSGSGFAEVIAKNKDLAAMLDGWRSDDKLSEPEAAEIATIGDRTFALIGLERASGVMVYDITDPEHATFETFVANFDPTKEVDEPGAGDFSPESVHFIPAADSPTGADMVMVANEWSGSTSFYSFMVSTADGGNQSEDENDDGKNDNTNGSNNNDGDTNKKPAGNNNTNHRDPQKPQDNNTGNDNNNAGNHDTGASSGMGTGEKILAAVAVLGIIAAVLPFFQQFMIVFFPQIPVIPGLPPIK